MFAFRNPGTPGSVYRIRNILFKFLTGCIKFVILQINQGVTNERRDKSRLY